MRIGRGKGRRVFAKSVVELILIIIIRVTTVMMINMVIIVRK